jgi:hypothetical protein
MLPPPVLEGKNDLKFVVETDLVVRNVAQILPSDIAFQLLN